MSYDLYFTSPKITREEFTTYFKANSLYQLSDQQAEYKNENTGVYFSFVYNSEPIKDELETEYWISININYNRPHYFALEAEQEVRRFIDQFECSIFDIQNDGMFKGPYSRDGFLKGWNSGNSFWFSVLKSQADATTIVHSRSTEELEKIWNWNISIQKRRDASAEDIFIPRIFFMLINGSLGSVCVWPDAISTLIPNVDYLFIPRKEMAPKKFFKKQDDHCIVERKDFPGFFQSFSTKAFEFEAFKLPAPETPSLVKEFVRNLKKFDGSAMGVGNDQVVNLELLGSI